MNPKRGQRAVKLFFLRMLEEKKKNIRLIPTNLTKDDLSRVKPWDIQICFLKSSHALIWRLVYKWCACVMLTFVFTVCNTQLSPYTAHTCHSQLWPRIFLEDHTRPAHPICEVSHSESQHHQLHDPRTLHYNTRVPTLPLCITSKYPSTCYIPYILPHSTPPHTTLSVYYLIILLYILLLSILPHSTRKHTTSVYTT